MQINEIMEVIFSFLTCWKEGDPRSAVIYIQPAPSQVPPSPRKLEICVSWDPFKAEVCTDRLSHYKLPESDPRHCLVQALKAIASSSGHGKIAINPRRKSKLRNGMIEFEVVWIISHHIKVSVQPL